ncbi:MAG: DUF3780 domain-containing protein [Deltaproteobacteria bacterium]|nr:DUF3780 domain-containing protein [Deltaproteobacteria bacterium]
MLQTVRDACELHPMALDYALGDQIEHLRPEERWCLFSMADATCGTSDDAGGARRRAIGIALSQTGSKDPRAPRARRLPRKRSAEAEAAQFQLFGSPDTSDEAG